MVFNIQRDREEERKREGERLERVKGLIDAESTAFIVTYTIIRSSLHTTIHANIFIYTRESTLSPRKFKILKKFASFQVIDWRGNVGNAIAFNGTYSSDVSFDRKVS